MDQCAAHKKLPYKTTPGEVSNMTSAACLCACYIVKSAATIDCELKSGYKFISELNLAV